MSTNEKFFKGSENIFADIGISYPEKVQARAKIMFLIAEIIKRRDLTQKQASKLLGIPQSKVSCLMNGKLSMFSLDHLFQLLNSLDNDVEITVKPKRRNERIATTHVLQMG